MNKSKITSLLLVSIILLTLVPTLTACSSESYGDGYNKGFDEGYSRGWQEGYDEGLSKATSLQSQTQTPSSTTTPTISLGELTLEDAEYILNLIPFLPAAFEKVDAASEGMSNADLDLGSDFSEVQLFVADEPFQMIYGIFSVSESSIERASWDSMMNDEELISDLIVENLVAGALEEGFEIQDPTITITNPDVGDSAIYGEGYFSSYGLTVGFDTLWFRTGKAYVMLYSSYFSLEREDLFPIALEIEQRINQYSN